MIETTPVRNVSIHLLQMDSNIIYEVLRHLDVEDLSHVARTCTDLKESADSTFLRAHQKHFKCYINQSLLFDNHRQPSTRILVYQEFGHLLKSITIQGTRIPKDQKILCCIANRCQHLIELNLDNVKEDLNDVSDENKRNVINLFSNLHRLSIYECDLPGWETTMASVDWKIKVLDLRPRHFVQLSPYNRTYGSLKKLTIKLEQTDKFLKLNEHIDELRLVDAHCLSVIPEYMAFDYVLCLKSLTKLTVDIPNVKFDLLSIGKISNLQYLFLSLDVQIHYDEYCGLLHVLQHHNKLEKLHLHTNRTKADGRHIEFIGKPFANIKELYISRYSDLLHIIPRMANIVKLQIKFDFWDDVDLEPFRNIFTIPHLEHLVFYTDGHGMKTIQQNEKREKWKEILQVRNKNYQSKMVARIHCHQFGSSAMQQIRCPRIMLLWNEANYQLSDADELNAIDAETVTFDQANAMSRVVLNFRPPRGVLCYFCHY